MNPSEGLQAILDPNDTSNGFEREASEAGVIVDGVVQRKLAISLVENNPAAVVGVFFRGATETDVVRRATLSVR